MGLFFNLSPRGPSNRRHVCRRQILTSTDGPSAERINYIPNKMLSSNVGVTLGQRRIRWIKIKSILGRRLLFAGLNIMLLLFLYSLNPLAAKLFNGNFQPLEVVSR